MKKLLLSLVLTVYFFICNAQSPSITSISPTSGAVGTLVAITGTNLKSPITFTIGGPNAIVVSNSDTQLVGMVMPGAVTGKILLTTAGGTVGSSNNFTVTPTSYPSVQQGGKLMGTGTLGGSQGLSSSISSDGNTAIVGGYEDNNGNGAAWIFTRSNGIWSQQIKLQGTGAIHAWQGCSVALSGDGKTAMVGGCRDNNYTGAVWVFTRYGDIWTQQGSKLVGTGAIGGAYQGRSVSLSYDGNTAIVGGDNDNNSLGAVWIYIRSGGIWMQQGSKLSGTDAIGSIVNQGFSVSLSADGNTAIVGGSNDNNRLGAAWIYTRSGGIWSQQGNKLIGTGAMYNEVRQGYSVSLSADGNTAIVGGINDNISIGAVWIYTRSGSIWSQQGGKLVGTGGTSNQGNSVSLSSDGNTAIVGGASDNGGIGAFWMYTRSGGTWTQEGNKLTGDGALGKAYQGRSVSMSSDGNTVIVGGDGDNNTSGAVWIFTRSISNWTQQGTKLVGTGVIGNACQGYSVSISSNGNTAIVGGPDDNTNDGAAWIYTRSGGVWSQQGNKLVGLGAIGGAQQGYSISISSDGNTAIVGGYYDNYGIGAVWFYTRSGGVWIQQGNKFVGTGVIGIAQHGISVSISADGNTAAVGGCGDNNNTGAVWIYTRFNGTWSQMGSKLIGIGAVGNAFQGRSVSISSDGNTIIVGGNGDNNSSGAAWVFIRSGGLWTQQGSKLVGAAAIGFADQGRSVSLSADGNTAIVGGPKDNSNAGAIWIYTRYGGQWTPQGNKLVGNGASGPGYQGGSASLSSDGNTALVGGVNDNYGAGATWIYTRSGTEWTQKGSKLVGAGVGSGLVGQGRSVSLASDGNTAIIGGNYDNNNAGASWIFTSSPNLAGTNQFELKLRPLIVYPNPSNGACIVQSENEGVYTILNPLGQTVHTFRLNAANSYTQNIDNLESGIYFIVGDGSDGRIGTRMVVAK